MTDIYYIPKEGDLFTSDAQVIGHGVNTKGLMGAGVARIVATKYPEVKTAYVDKCKISSFKAGSCQLVDTHDGKVIANMATQIFPGPHASLELIRKALDNTIYEMQMQGFTTLATPRIGAGIGGLNWDDVEKVVNDIAYMYQDVTIEVWTLPETKSDRQLHDTTKNLQGDH